MTEKNSTQPAIVLPVITDESAQFATELLDEALSLAAELTCEVPACAPAPERVGLVTGVFDVLHQGHLKLLRQARQACDRLLVAIESDTRVKRLKGKSRPLFSQDQRQARLRQVVPDGVTVEILPEDFGEEAVRREWLRERGVKYLFTLKNDPRLLNKELLMLETGGRVVFLAAQPNLSTTRLLESRRVPQGLVFSSDREAIVAYRKAHQRGQK